MSNIKFKVEIKGVEVKEGDIVDITIGDLYVNHIKGLLPISTSNYVGRISKINNETNKMTLDCSKVYESNLVDFDLDNIEEIKIKYIEKQTI